MNNKERIKEIEKQISLLQKEKERLEYEDSIPDIENKINDYLARTYTGRKLSQTHQMDEEGFWEVRGEDPNCDLGGYHHEPKLGVVAGTLKDALTFALRHGSFYTWGGGGSISKIDVIKMNNNG